VTLTTLRRLWRPERPERVNARDGYARWADTYAAAPHNPLMAAEQAVTVPLLAGAAGRRVLDVGCGTGRNAGLLIAAGARRVVGIDLSPAMLERHPHTNGRICGDAGALPFRSGSFDMVCSSLMVGDLPDIAAWAREASRVLSPGGDLVYSDFHPSWKENRWRRTFRTSNGRLCELPFFPHTIETHLGALDSAGFAVRIIREPRLSGGTAPVVVVFHAVKTGRQR
jgi:malonyl-CoA O-methyltransferase